MYNTLTNNRWVLFSFIATFSTAFALLTLKLLKKTKFDILILLGFSYIISAIISIIYILNNKSEFIYIKNNLSILILALVFLFSLFHICSQYFMSNAIALSPNTGYCHLIVNLNIIITLIASYFIFKEKINIHTALGILITLIGVGIVIYYSNN